MNNAKPPHSAARHKTLKARSRAQKTENLTDTVTSNDSGPEQKRPGLGFNLSGLGFKP